MLVTQEELALVDDDDLDDDDDDEEDEDDDLSFSDEDSAFSSTPRRGPALKPGGVTLPPSSCEWLKSAG